VTEADNSGQRLFFALWPTPEVQQRLHGVGRLALGRHAGRLVPAESVHLTLAFLGTLAPELSARAREIVGGNPWHALELRFDRIGWFRRSRVLWAGCSETPPALIDYVEQLRRELAAAEVPVDGRPFQPHVTLVRKVRRPPTVREMEEVACSFEQIHLVRSVATEAGSRYEIVCSWPEPEIGNGSGGPK
jgi:2'-5' RNA ligase